MRYVDGVLDGDWDLETWLTSLIPTAEVVALRTSFLTMAGAELVRALAIEMLESGGRLDVVLGDSPDQTEVEALRWLASIASDFPDQMSIYLASPSSGWQNAKTYYIREPQDRRYAYIGSANLTRGGLANNREAGIVLESSVDDSKIIDTIYKGICAWFEHPNARRVTPEVIEGFAEKARLGRIARVRYSKRLAPTRRLLELMPRTLDIVEVAGRSDSSTAGISTGFSDLDSLIGGLLPGSLTVVGGRPAIGKSTLLLNILRAAAVKHQIPAALFSLEMLGVEINHRILAAESRVRLHALRSGLMNDDDWTRLALRMAEIAHAPLFLNETGSLAIGSLVDEAVRLVREEGVRVIAVDYLQLVMPNGQAESREREVSDVARELKALALDLEVAVVAAAQLNRGPEQRTDRRPLLMDFRDSDAIAQTADVVILLHREDAYERESPRAGEADFIVAKHRNGPTATVTVAFQGHYSRFVDMAPG